jgi:hypothetical protein
MLRYIPSFSNFFRAFVMKGFQFLSKVIFCINWDDHVIFFLDSVYVLYYICWFTSVEPSLCPWSETYLIMVMIFLICSWIQFASILLRIFASIFIKVVCL